MTKSILYILNNTSSMTISVQSNNRVVRQKVISESAISIQSQDSTIHTISGVHATQVAARLSSFGRILLAL